MSFRLAAAIVAGLLYIQPAFADAPRDVDWLDLVPSEFDELDAEAGRLQERLEALPEADQAAFRKIGAQRMLQSKVKAGTLKVEELMPDNRTIFETDFRAAFPEASAIADAVDRLTARADALDRTANATLDGVDIRMPGYVLPIEFDGVRTTEFLLVPFVGACIHVPPPPPNQIVHVTYRPGFENEGLYAPVVVTGRMSTRGSTVDLHLTDGRAPVESGYALEAARIEPYKE